MNDSSGIIVIKPSYFPFVGKSLRFFIVAPIIYFALSYAVQFLATSSVGNAIAPIPIWVAALVFFIGFISLMFSAVQRNAFTYTITSNGIIINRSLVSRDQRQISFDAISDVQVVQSILGRLLNYGDIYPVTRSGFGLTSGRGGNMQDTNYSYVAEMTDTPSPFAVADAIRERIDLRYRAATNREPP